jgi:hypothetical protein
VAPFLAEHRLAASVIFPQGGSTLTQQLVRGYFLRHMTVQEDGGTLIGNGLLATAASKVLGVPATNKLARKIEEIRLTFWLESEMERRFGSKQRAKQEILARYASFIYMGNGRYGFSAASSTTSPSRSPPTGRRTRTRRLSWPASPSRLATTRPPPGTWSGRGGAATTSWPSWRATAPWRTRPRAGPRPFRCAWPRAAR